MTIAANDTKVWLRAPGGQIWQLTAGTRLQEMAMRWNSVVRNRERWDGEGDSSELQDRARTDLDSIGLTDGIRHTLVEAGIGEVGTVWMREEDGWEARVMPWEFVISLATRNQRDGRLLTIWRHIDAGKPLLPISTVAPSSLLFVDSTPGPLKTQLSFQADQKVIAAALELEPQVLVDPEALTLQEQLKDSRHDVVHLATIDDVEVSALLGETNRRRTPGLCLAGRTGDIAMCPNWVTAQMFVPARVRLLTFGAQRSSRVAAHVVAFGGANVAIGFQDSIDREATRTFYAEFYRQWRLNRFSPHVALIQTRVALRAKGLHLNGAGLVLCSDRTLIDVDQDLLCANPAASSVASANPASATFTKPPVASVLQAASPATVVEVTCEPLPRLNYSLLHNDRDLFKRFALVSPGDGAVAGVCVRVVLSAGGQDVAWKAQLTLTEVITDLRSKVRVPVVSALGRIKESVRSTLLVEVEVGGQLIHQSTHPVQLLAGDEWTDDDQDRQWLPSFVLPRDPAVTRIVDQAQRALCTLADDPEASFDGYQGLGIRAGDDPGIAVDLQAQALWAALTWDIGLAYVNPPPTYTAAAQRVRSPSAVLEERRGTCIDLALLLAACWERIGLRPVILLLKGHALPGYWRSEAAWDAFRRGDYTPNVSPNANQADPVTAATAGWMVEEHDEVVRLVRAQAWWPVEATRIPKRSGFASAVQAGMDALRLAADFDCLIDISVAREKGVLPLP